MKVKIPGHAFELDSYDGGEPVTLHFMMRQGDKYPGNTSSQPGTNCQEVLRALISRCGYLNQQVPAIETVTAIYLMRAALLQFEIRAKRMKGKYLDLHELRHIEVNAACSVCGHLRCTEGH